MKNWTRTSLLLLAFSIGACEGQGPTAPTSSLTQSGALATGAQGQMTTLTDGGTGDIQQARGGKDCVKGDTRPKCNEEPPDGDGNDKVTYSVDAVAPPPSLGCADWNTWISSSPGFTHQNGSLSPRWGPGDLKVTTKPDVGMRVPLMNDAFVVVFADKVKGQPSKIIAVDLFIKDAAFAQYETDRLFISLTVSVDSADGFTIPVQRDGVRVYEGKTDEFVGTICVGDLDFCPVGKVCSL